jgi:hypothetical protein
VPAPPNNGRGRAPDELPGLKTQPNTATYGPVILPDQADDHARQVRRLATIELARLLYGPVADLRPTLPGPAVCPPSCRYCARRRAA